MESLNEKENKEEMQTASRDVIGIREDRLDNLVDEDVQVSGRRGRKGRSNAAQLESDQSDVTNENTQYRVLISPEANTTVDDLIIKVNTGFDGGKVTRPQLVSWVLCKFGQTMTESDTQEIRSLHFDRIAYFEALLKRAKESGVIPPELASLLPASNCSVAATKKRRAS